MTGRQLGSVRDILEGLTKEFGKVRGHHGDCVGSDAQFHILARKYGAEIIGHPPSDPKKRAFCQFDSEWPVKDYLVRNRDIVWNTDRVLAVPKEHVEVLRSGTWAAIRETMKVGRTLYIAWPNGTITVRRTT